MTKGIYKRGNIYWLRYLNLDGKIRYESVHSDKFKDAEILLAQRRSAIAENREVEIKRIVNHLFRELSADYLKWAERQRCYRYKTIMVGQLTKYFGDMQLRRISTKLVEQYQTEMMTNHKPATVNRLLATLKHMFTKAIEWDMVEEECLKRVRRVKLLEENNRRLRYLDYDECNRLIDHCTIHLKPIVITALNTGMRKEEILSLKWDNVDLKGGFILLDRTKNGERREIPINGTVGKTLQSLTRRLDSPYVFHNSDSGSRWQDVKRSFTQACKRSKLTDLHFHDLRHTFASHLIMAGVDLTSVKELLGHKTLNMTMRYAHLAPSHKVRAVNILDGEIGVKQNAMR